MTKTGREQRFVNGRGYLGVGCGNSMAAVQVAETFGLPVAGVDVNLSK